MCLYIYRTMVLISCCVKPLLLLRMSFLKLERCMKLGLLESGLVGTNKTAFVCKKRKTTTKNPLYFTLICKVKFTNYNLQAVKFTVTIKWILTKSYGYINTTMVGIQKFLMTESSLIHLCNETLLLTPNWWQSWI